MNRSAMQHIALGLLFFTAGVSRSDAVITVNIYSDIYQHAVFEMSGQFDGPADPALPALVSFAFAPSSIANSSAQIYPFASPLATLVDTTTGGSADITGFDCYGQYYSYAYFDLGAPLSISAGDTLELISHGPVDLPNYSFGDFVPGNYTLSDISLGPTTFEVNVVPEPSSLVLLGLGLSALPILRKLKPWNGVLGVNC